MTSLAEDFEIDVSDESSLSDFVDKASKHHWKVGYKFPHAKRRNPRQTPSGKKYGTGKTFKQIYDEMGETFLEAYFDEQYPYSYLKDEGDRLLSEINAEVGITVDTIVTAKDEVFQMEKKTDTNYSRMSNALERLNNQQEKFETKQETYFEQENTQRERLNSLQSEISNLEGTLRRTKQGSFDRRTTGYNRYSELSRELSGIYDSLDNARREYDKSREDLDKATANYERESSRYENSMQKRETAINNLNRIKDGSWSKIKNKYADSAEEFAKLIKDDIVSMAQNGTLPMQNKGLSPKTMAKRESVGLNSLPRFYATGQLVKSIIVVCKLV